MIPLTSRHAALLRDLQNIWPSERFVVIGATAIACHLDFRWRETIDLDLLVATTSDEYAKDLERLGWRREAGAPQRWITSDGSYVDILPAAPALVRKGEFTWPDGSARLTLVGFRLAFADSVPIEQTPGIHARVASIPSLVVLKIASYFDRPWERDNDLDDIAHILTDFLTYDDERRWSNEIMDLGLEFDDASPFVLGKRMGALVDDAERTLVQKFLSTVDDPGDPLATIGRMARAAHLAPTDSERLRSRFKALRRGFELPRQRARCGVSFTARKGRARHR